MEKDRAINNSPKYQFEEYTHSGNGQSLTSDGLDINYKVGR